MADKRPLERTVEETLRRGCVRRHVLCWKLRVLGIAGIPDRMLLAPGGRVAFVELKRLGEKPRPLQTYWLDKLRRLGFTAEVIDSADQVEPFFNRWSESC